LTKHRTLEEWQRDASTLIRVQMLHKDIGYKELSRSLEALGISENAKALSNKVSRGTFSLVFYLQCMRALGITSVKLPD
jgi:hypothetical protein